MKRSVKKSRKVVNKKVRNATATTSSDGTKFRSKLELYTYNKLKDSGIKDFKYEEDKFVLQDSFEFDNLSVEAYEKTVRNDSNSHKMKMFGDVDHSIRTMTYLPDFTCINEDKTGWVLEVKGYSNDAFPLKWKLFKKHLKDNGYNVDLYKPNNQGNVLKCINMIKEKYYA